MSVSGILRMELGDYIKFEPSMLPKKALNTNAVSTQSDSIQKDKIEERNAKANALGIKPEEFIKLFNMAQEARVKELEETIAKSGAFENSLSSNPFSDN